MSRHVNEEYFKHRYPGHWLSGRRQTPGEVHRRYQDVTLDRLDVRPGHRVLECGCGSGELGGRVLERVPSASYVGVDLGAASLRHAGREFAETRASWAQADLLALPFADGSFDRVFASSVLWYVPDPAAAVAEMVRVLRPGGRFVFDVRNPYHVTNVLAGASLGVRRALGRAVPTYSFLTPAALDRLLAPLPVRHEVEGFFVLVPTRLPVLGTARGNLARLTPRLAFESGTTSWGQWAAQKLLVWGARESSD